MTNEGQGAGRTGSQSKADELEERLIDFAVRVVKLSAALPRTSAGKHIAGQILRSGTSPAPNYGEARGAESHADFVHKLRVVWLRVIERSQILKRVLLADIIGNCAGSLPHLLKPLGAEEMTNENSQME